MCVVAAGAASCRGDGELATIFWRSELFIPQGTDTYTEVA